MEGGQGGHRHQLGQQGVAQVGLPHHQGVQEGAAGHRGHEPLLRHFSSKECEFPQIESWQVILWTCGDAGEIIGIHDLKDGGEVLEMDEEDVGVIEKELGDTSSRASRVLDVDADK